MKSCWASEPINWGNVILIAMIGLLVVGGGGFVAHKTRSWSRFRSAIRKRWKVNIPPMLWTCCRRSLGLKPQARKSLKNILDNPEKTEKVLGLIDAVVSDKKTKE